MSNPVGENQAGKDTGACFEYWYEAIEGSPKSTWPIHPNGRRMNRRLNLYFLLAGLGWVPLAVLAVKAGLPPLLVGVVGVSVCLGGMLATSFWYLKNSVPRTRVISNGERPRARTS